MSLMIEQFVTTGFGSSKPALNSQKSYRNHITQFEIFLKARQKTAGDGTVTDQDILDYTEQLHSKYQPNTVAARMGAIKSYFRWLQKQGLTCHPTIRSQKITLPIHKELDSSALKVVLEQLTGDNLATKRDLAGFSLVIYCGFTTSEVVALNVENLKYPWGQAQGIPNS